MKILVTGITGQVGGELQRLLSREHEVIGCDRTQLDLAQPDTLVATVKAWQPELIINPAAYTAVDKAETAADQAYSINGVAPGHLAQAATELNIPFIHLSTDYVFDGRKSSPYLESDPTGPQGVYGQSKLAGETAIRAICDRHLILRTAWVYGCRGQGNFVKTMLRLGQERPELRVVMDQIGTPTWAADIAAAIANLIPHLGADLYGTYHFTNSGAASWYDFAVAILEEARLLGFPLTANTVQPITTADYPTPARRPAYSVLGCGKITTVLGTTPPHWRVSLRHMLSELYRDLS